MSNPALFSAIANDFGYQEVFAIQLRSVATSADVLVLVSSSGDSANIVAAARAAREIGIPVIGLTGFSGGRLREMADVSVHVPADRYGLVEDAHQVLMHVIALEVAARMDGGTA